MILLLLLLLLLCCCCCFHYNCFNIIIISSSSIVVVVVVVVVHVIVTQLDLLYIFRGQATTRSLRPPEIFEAIFQFQAELPSVAVISFCSNSNLLQMTRQIS